MNGEDEKQEIIIIKRGGDHGDGHHGGAWKIAFADFMTAMMALFLVLWLVNAANEETKKSVASYFNPVKLVDRNRSTKGLNEMSGGPVESSEESEESIEAVEPETHQQEDVEQAHTDADLREDPYKVLAEIAEGADDGLEGDTGQSSSATDIQYQDPFAPDFWNKEAGQLAAELDGEDALQPDIDTKTAALDSIESVSAGQSRPNQPAKEDSEATGRLSAESVEKMDDRSPDEPAPADAQAALDKDDIDGEEEADVNKETPSNSEQIVDEIKKAIDQAFGENDPIFAGLTVEEVEEGALISITDRLEWSMFKIGSAVPRRDLVLAMEKIARVLAEQNGNVRLRGHTDGRQFAGDSFGNWRLSATRAQTAYHMLVRAGFDGRRISQITGFADRQLKLTDNPLAAVNRRIEILLEVPN
ncbi:MAG: MotB family protein [Rhizobiaceae bacterium]